MFSNERQKQYSCDNDEILDEKTNYFMTSLLQVLVSHAPGSKVEGWMRKRGFSMCCAVKLRYCELDAQRRLVLIRKGPALPCIDFIDFNDPVSVDEPPASTSSVIIISSTRVYQFEADSPEEAQRWLQALRPLTAGRSVAAFSPDSGGLGSRVVEQDDGRHHAQRIWVNDLVATCRTGDIILFSTKDGGASTIRFFTGSERNHVPILAGGCGPRSNCGMFLFWQVSGTTSV
jgi:hypothetical protein